ncbi:hypothetical protein GCM10009759_61050 [Kitasatospora saccharophila]|uniref:VanZ-like domain-containing protein n=1 Tax=Kitasatospora saccharophila TaxID=407973 RepID=A0ABN2XSW5_9ACTN
MIEASLSAAPSLFPAFAVLGALFGTAAFLLARRRERPPLAPALFAVALAGEVAVTLTPTTGGASGEPNCTFGGGIWRTVLEQQGLLNTALYVPLAALGAWAFRRPLSVLAGCAVLSAGTELLQTLLGTGRACDAADFVDNSSGALLGALLAVAVVALAPSWRGTFAPGRDALRALTTAGSGLAAVALVVWLFVPVYDAPETGSPFPNTVDTAGTAYRLMDRLFGPGGRLEVTSTVFDPALSRFPLTEAAGDRGRFRFEAVSGRLVSVQFPTPTPAPTPSPDGTAASPLPEEQLLRAAGEFATTWFPDLTDGTRPALAPAPTTTGSPVPAGARLLTFHRPANGLPPSGHLEVTVSASGRVLSATAYRPDDRTTG